MVCSTEVQPEPGETYIVLSDEVGTDGVRRRALGKVNGGTGDVIHVQEQPPWVERLLNAGAGPCRT